MNSKQVDLWERVVYAEDLMTKSAYISGTISLCCYTSEK